MRFAAVGLSGRVDGPTKRLTPKSTGQASRWAEPRTQQGSFRVALGLILLSGLILRVTFMEARGHGFYATFDTQSTWLITRSLLAHPLSAYTANAASSRLVWPYPPGAFLWLGPLAAISSSHNEFATLIRLPEIGADLAIAWLVQSLLGRRGASPAARLAAAALIALGPTFVGSSAVEGQFDSIAFLPAVLACWLWDRLPPGRREIAAGLLIGCGAAVKSVPIVLVLAFVPWLENRGALGRLLFSAAVVPCLLTVPFVIGYPATLHQIVSYQGGFGWGGLSIFVEPSSLRAYVDGGSPVWNPAQHELQELARVLLPEAVLGATLALFWRRRSPERGMVLILTTVYVLMPNFFSQYAVWGLALAAAAGYVRAALAAQGVLVVPLIVESQWPTPHPAMLVWDFVLLTIAWLICLSAWVVLVRDGSTLHAASPASVGSVASALLRRRTPRWRTRMSRSPAGPRPAEAADAAHAAR